MRTSLGRGNRIDSIGDEGTGGVGNRRDQVWRGWKESELEERTRIPSGVENLWYELQT